MDHSGKGGGEHRSRPSCSLVLSRDAAQVAKLVRDGITGGISHLETQHAFICLVSLGVGLFFLGFLSNSLIRYN